ncbi:XRE family transcriptional regulator [Streptomyces sp. uw30]|uniref:helix-turn-helix domain-containing protein n=1 Tax=Streptomyces sp. uw30 TaxID=1828179 RepID=UPI0011CE6A74|nr:helix-turn-helix transcriptional regulator [Streptomyces sp. uw30]TXS52095.1 XRE family transcriptional regulator [Streptomyces sp. uw30]
MGITGEPQPQQTTDAAEFVAALRRLKDRSGLTYRQLEERAAEHGEVLARSTLADVLGGKTAPRPELLAAFVRVCGQGDRVGDWLAARERISRQQAAGPESGKPTWRARLTGRRRRLGLLAGVALLSLVSVTAWALVSADEPEDTGRGGSASPGDSPRLPEGPVQIRPVLAQDLCLTEGYVQRYDSQVAVQRPCDEVAPQTTTLEPLGGHAFRIQWFRPDQGKGCLTVLTEKPLTGLLEPRNACAHGSRFRIEPSSAEEGGRYVFRVDDQTCLGIKHGDTSTGTEALLEPCRGHRSQQFIVEAAP